jgi:hypothetical protein
MSTFETSDVLDVGISDVWNVDISDVRNVDIANVWNVAIQKFKRHVDVCDKRRRHWTPLGKTKTKERLI